MKKIILSISALIFMGLNVNAQVTPDKENNSAVNTRTEKEIRALQEAEEEKEKVLTANKKNTSKKNETKKSSANEQLKLELASMVASSLKASTKETEKSEIKSEVKEEKPASSKKLEFTATETEKRILPTMTMPSTGKPGKAVAVGAATVPAAALPSVAADKEKTAVKTDGSLTLKTTTIPTEDATESISDESTQQTKTAPSPVVPVKEPTLIKVEVLKPESIEIAENSGELPKAPETKVETGKLVSSGQETDEPAKADEAVEVKKEEPKAEEEEKIIEDDKAAETDSSRTPGEAEYDKGVMEYSDGNYAVAFVYFKSAAESGYSAAMYNLGVMYASGLGTQKDEKEALKWFAEAAKKGNKQAEAMLQSIKKAEEDYIESFN